MVEWLVNPSFGRPEVAAPGCFWVGDGDGQALQAVLGSLAFNTDGRSYAGERRGALEACERLSAEIARLRSGRKREAISQAGSFESGTEAFRSRARSRA